MDSLNLALFDIDKTLLDSSSSQKAAFADAFNETFGIAVTARKAYPGRTDSYIVRAVAEEHGISGSIIDDKLQSFINAYETSFLERVSAESLSPMPGASALLKLLKDEAHCGLITGNCARIARGKMERVGFARYFPFGAYGSEHWDRTELVKLAIQRGRDAGWTSEQAFVIGDAPPDMDAGNKGGATTIGVASGDFSMDELLNAGATYVVPNLHDPLMLELLIP